ncbi:longitudinals lacking protein, isoforms A/B/D/L [Ptiloglossa arizonensis]|uniref:longitudinals lacking protein, isoforms A/B/D/L n=1 Tax=Ptiloglossa arizonensis TaxID=3350558 RepID=UPI003FA1542F
MIAENQMAENATNADIECPTNDQENENEPLLSEKTSEKRLNETPKIGARDSSEYACPRCGNGYVRLHSLNRHIKFECGVEPRFECPVCHKKSKHKHNLILHMRTHQKS